MKFEMLISIKNIKKFRFLSGPEKLRMLFLHAHEMLKCQQLLAFSHL